MMQVNELYVITLYIAEGSTPQKICYTRNGEGIPIQRETSNCWYIDNPIHGLPGRFRKAEEYRLLNNRFGIYMFGSDSKTLAKMWNEFTSAET